MTIRRLVAFAPALAAALLPAAPAFAETLQEATAAAVRRHPTLMADQATVRSADENVVAARSELRGDGRCGFVVGPYDPSRPLTVDPPSERAS